MDQPGPGLQAVARPLIIHYSTASHPLTRLRDTVLFLLCWAMWSVVLTAVINSTEWEDLGDSIAGWLGAHLAFVRVVMTSFHFPAGYVSMVAILVCAFLIWSNLGPFSPRRDGDAGGGKAALSLEEMARQFGLDSKLIGPMQKEAQVVVFHAPSGAIIGMRAQPQPAAVAAGVDAAPLHLASV